MTPGHVSPDFTANGLFTRLGEPVDAADTAAVTGILRGTAFSHEDGVRRREPDVAIVVVASWNEAARIVDAEERDSVLWDTGEGERERLWDIATERFTESELLERLTTAVASWKVAILDAARFAGERYRIADPRFAPEAARAAQTALHHSHLARLAIDDQAHPFQRTLALFLRGRWPLGGSGNRFSLF